MYFNLSVFASWASLAAVLTKAAFMMLLRPECLSMTAPACQTYQQIGPPTPRLCESSTVSPWQCCNSQTFGTLILFCPTPSSWWKNTVNVGDVIELIGKTLLFPLCHLLNDLFRSRFLRSLLHLHFRHHHLFLFQTNQKVIFVRRLLQVHDHLRGCSANTGCMELKLLSWLMASHLSIFGLTTPIKSVLDAGFCSTIKTLKDESTSGSIHQVGLFLFLSHYHHQLMVKLPLHTSSSLRNSPYKSIP